MLTMKERLLLLAEDYDLSVYDTVPHNAPVDGLYLHGAQGSLILMKKSLPDERYVPVLAEEMGHHLHSHGLLVEQSNVVQIKSENAGRAWAMEYLLPLCKFILAWGAYGCRCSEDYAETFGLDVGFVADTMVYLRRKNLWPQDFEPYFRMLAKPNHKQILSRQRTLQNVFR